MKQRSAISDYIGISSAFICLVHCLIAPIIVGLAASGHAHDHGASSFFLSHHWDYIFLGIGFGAVWYSSKHAHSVWLRALLWTSFAFLAGALMMEEQALIFQYLAYAASISLIIAHVVNIVKAIRVSI